MVVTRGMHRRPDPYDRDLLLSLAADYLHGTGSRADADRLEALLRGDPAARREFVGYAMLHGQIALSQLAAAPRGGDGEIAPAVRDGGTEAGGAAARGRPGRRMTATIMRAALAAVGAALLVLLLSLPAVERLPVVVAGGYDQRQLPVVTVASVHDVGAAPRPLTLSTLHAAQATDLRTASGADVRLSESAVFGVTAAGAGALFGGSVRARLSGPEASFAVTTSNLRIVDHGTAFTVERIDEDHVTVTVLDGAVEVQSRVRLPICYWPFDDRPAAAAGDGDERRTVDVVRGLPATLGRGAMPVAGLVGAGAVRFDDTPSAVVRIDGGTGDRVGTGLLALTEGITIEALIVSEWSGRFRDYDEIYRKEDGTCRVLLSLQHDDQHHDEPDVAPGPCLSFGLHLAGRGYAELDMPLDGVAGRPTLAELTDGRPHHVVATYDSFTGRKAVFIDGVERFAHVYPVGTLILSGGPAVAEIGNTRGGEPFRGVIDEFALYDFALTADEIAEHQQRVAAGETYFGGSPPVRGGPRWQAVTRLVAGETMTFDRRTGLSAP